MNIVINAVKYDKGELRKVKKAYNYNTTHLECTMVDVFLQEMIKIVQ